MVRGLFIIASLFAAYRSTMETHLNWGSSYLVIDFYQRFLAPGRTERHYLWVSRSLTAVLMILCGVFKNGSGPSGLLTLPEAAWELSLGIYCAWKGFRPSPIAEPKVAST